MAKGKKTGGKDYAPGHKNPGPGRPPLPSDIIEIKKLNIAEMERVLNQCLTMSRAEIDELRKKPDASMLELLVVSIIGHGVNKGDPFRLGFLLDRLLGKVKENHEIELSQKTLHILIDDKSEEKYAL